MNDASEQARRAIAELAERFESTLMDEIEAFRGDVLRFATSQQERIAELEVFRAEVLRLATSKQDRIEELERALREALELWRGDVGIRGIGVNPNYDRLRKVLP